MKNYQRRSNILFLVCMPLMLLSIISFFKFYSINWTIVLIFFQWTTVCFLLGLCYHVIDESKHRQTTTRKEEFIFLTLRFIIILPLAVLIFDAVDIFNFWETLLTWAGILSVSSTLSLCTLSLFLDKFELEIVLREANVK